jgi:uncharacterized protein (DUF305 family)
MLMTVLLMATPALAQQTAPPPAMPGMPTMAAPPGAGSTAGYQAAMAKMHAGMQIPYTGDADRDFVAGMIPHHQGAVDMAKVELQYGHDPRLRRLAHDIIASQDRQIAFMRQWQATHAK